MKILVGLCLLFGVIPALAGTKLVVRGSSVLVSQLAGSLAEAYGKKHPDVSFDLASSDEEKDAMAGLKDNKIDAALSTDEAKKGGFHVTAIAFIGMMVVVNPANGVDRLTHEQALRIFSGKVTNWSEVGGAAGPIDLYAVVQNLSVLGDGVSVPVNAMLDDNQVVNAVMQDKHALGMVTTLGLNGVKELAMDDVAPSIATLRKHSYFFSWPVYLYLQETPSDTALDFLNFILSPDGQDLVETAGLASLK